MGRTAAYSEDSLDGKYKTSRTEEFVGRLSDFQNVLVDSLPSSKELRTQRKKTRKAYKLFMASLDEMEWLDHIEDSTRIPRQVWLWISVGFVGLLTVLSFFVKSMGIFMTRFIGLAYPMYASIKALITDEKDDDTQWLTYWVVYALFALFEQIALQQDKALPVYFAIKVAFLLFCQFAHGAELVYKVTVKPFSIAVNALFKDRLGDSD